MSSPSLAGGPGVFTLAFFPEGGSVDENALREEVERNVEALNAQARGPESP